mgnify:CR=1 FL=1
MPLGFSRGAFFCFRLFTGLISGNFQMLENPSGILAGDRAESTILVYRHNRKYADKASKALIIHGFYFCHIA